jgi:PAS domain-containing protein
MLLVRRAALAAFVLLAAAGALGLGVAAHSALASPPAAADAARLAGETLLFVSILIAGGLLLAGAALLWRSRRALRELAKVAELSRFGSGSIVEGLRRLGTLGEGVRQILARVAELNRQLALRLSTVSALNDLLLNNNAARFLVVDAAGNVTAASRGYREAAGSGSARLEGRHVGDLVEGVGFSSLYARLERERRVLTAESDPQLHFAPVFNGAGELACVVCVFGKEPVLGEAAPPHTLQRRGRALLGRLLRRRP